MPYDPDADPLTDPFYPGTTASNFADNRSSLSIGDGFGRMQVGSGSGRTGAARDEQLSDEGKWGGSDEYMQDEPWNMEEEVPESSSHLGGLGGFDGSRDRPSSQHHKTSTSTSSHPPVDITLTPRKQVAIMLQSSVKKEEFAAVPPDELMEEADELENLLVTSDITPKPRKRKKTMEEVMKSQLARQAAPAAAEPRRLPFPTATTTTTTTTTTSMPPTAITPQQPKKRGRPVGWKLGSGSYKAMKHGGMPGAATPSSTTPRPKLKKPKPPVAGPDGQMKKRGRTVKNIPTPRQIYLKLTPKYVPFICEWEGCLAELQNLETLRKHVDVVHGRESAERTCRWATCADPGQPPYRFKTAQEFERHIEQKHMAPIAYYVGDGPKNSSHHQPVAGAGCMRGDADPLPAYLFDKDGVNQVTPSIKDQRYEDEEERKKRRLRLHRVVMQRDSNAPEEPVYTQTELNEIAAALSAKKARQKMFGEYMDRYGDGDDGGEGKLGYGITDGKMCKA
ncbi:hypothetical protein QBC46DRAFT_377049 [Diplogelasinospora grovesii]|uniref:C2H2-type domain-containing protein n=1 Tax=Diplogelasinospora grovesii TaxID=303347 RepID=A0AAN6S7L5_9PEZI|nr:hypothetical protein QBC46DRAFT_377049 [Diplogelasinospora grovesii]